MVARGRSNAYNKGVLVGNWTEERSASAAGERNPFSGQSTSNSTYGVQAGLANGINERMDGQRLHACSGKDTILRHEEQHSRSTLADGLASISQLTYSVQSTCTDITSLGTVVAKFDVDLIAGRPDTAQRHVQEHLWTGHKATDLHMPACPKRADAMAAHQQQMEREASESQWATTSRSAAEAASQGAAGGACKRQGCRPAAPGGQPAQIGRKAVGECAQLFDRDWMRIGLRK